MKQDTAKAKQLAKDAGLPPGTKVSIAFNTGGGHEGWVQAVAGEIGDVLGWKVDIKPGPFKELLKAESDPKASGLFRAAWSADYPTSWNFLCPLLCTQPADNPGDNRGRYSNPQFDSLLAQGQAEPDAAKRADLYKQAEKIAIGQDLALIPLWYRTQYRAFDSRSSSGSTWTSSRTRRWRPSGSSRPVRESAGSSLGATRPILYRGGPRRSVSTPQAGHSVQGVIDTGSRRRWAEGAEVRRSPVAADGAGVLRRDAHLVQRALPVR